MRKRSGIFAVVAVGSLGTLGGLAAVVSASACGAENAADFYGAGDAGASKDGATTGPPDAAFLDGGVLPPGDASAGADSGTPAFDASADASIPPTTILAVHASANLYDFRLCFGVTSGASTQVLPVPAYPDDPAQPMPETNYPGVPVGGATLLPPIDLQGATVTPYVIRAQQLNKLGYVSTNPNEPTCDALVCPGSTAGMCLQEKYDYFALPPVTLPALGGTVALAIEGCAAQAYGPGSIAQCGNDYAAATGNLGAGAAALSPTTPGTWTVQIAQLSPSFVATGSGPSDSGSTALVYVDPTSDASVPLSPGPFPSVFLPRVTLPLSEAGVTSAYLSLTPALGSPLTQSLAAIQFFQSPASNPTTYFNAEATYFVAVVGDATDAAVPASLLDGAPNPSFDGHGLHVIAYPERGN